MQMDEDELLMNGPHESTSTFGGMGNPRGAGSRSNNGSID